MRTRNALGLYFGLAFGIAWGGVAFVAWLGSRPLTFVTMLLGPAVASLTLTAFLEGKEGLRSLARRLLRWRVGARWYSSALVAPSLLALILGWLSRWSPHFAPALATGASTRALVTTAIVAGLGAGVFEELGWTGFATPRLLRRHSWLGAGATLGLVWAVWHVLPDFLGRAVYGRWWTLHMGEWIVALVGFRCFMTWIYARTESVPLAMLLHATFTGGQVLLWPTPGWPSAEPVWYGIFAVALWIVVGLVVFVSRSVSMRHGGETEPFRGSDGEVLAGSIAEISYLRIGGVDQWVMIRGESLDNPLLVLLHGGPGFPEMRLFRHFNAALEKMFTVVYWEQRGTDKSFDSHIPLASMKAEQFVADTNELVDLLRKRFGKDRVTIYGHSWGSALGVLFVARHPEKVAAYVGTGQVGDWRAAEEMGYAFVLAEAERRKNARAIEQLRAIGPPPHAAHAMEVERKWLVRFVGMARGISSWRLLRIMLGGPEASILDLPNIVRGALFSPRRMWGEISALNLVQAVPALEVPVFFFIGRHDHVIDAHTSAAYFDALSAPSKKLVWFEESSHHPPVEEPRKFNTLMAEMVRPVAAQ